MSDRNVINGTADMNMLLEGVLWQDGEERRS